MERNTTNEPTNTDPTEAARRALDHETNYPKMQPRIYAASLGAYAAGHLHGSWIDANQQPDDLMADITEMLRTSPVRPAEEWAIHDYEGFGAFQPHEYERLETIARVAGGLALHGPAFAHWIHEVGTEAEDSVETFEDAYRGAYDSYSDIAEQFLDDMGFNPETILPDWITPYMNIDWGRTRPSHRRRPDRC